MFQLILDRAIEKYIVIIITLKLNQGPTDQVWV